ARSRDDRPISSPPAIQPCGSSGPVSRRRADELLQAVAFLVRAIGDRLGVLPPQVGGEPGQVGAGVFPLLAPGQAGDERLSELSESSRGPVEALRADLAFVERLLHAGPVTPVHRPPPARAVPHRKAFLSPALRTINRTQTAELKKGCSPGRSSAMLPVFFR